MKAGDLIKPADEPGGGVCLKVTDVVTDPGDDDLPPFLSRVIVVSEVTGNTWEIEPGLSGEIEGYVPYADKLPAKYGDAEARHLKNIREMADKAFKTHVIELTEDSRQMMRRWRCKRPDSFTYFFDVIVWPGWIVVQGDIGFMAWSRVPDMIAFVRGSFGEIEYPREKVPRSIRTEEFSAEEARAWVWREYAQRREAQLFEGQYKGKDLDDVRGDLMESIEDGRHFCTALYDSDWYDDEAPDVMIPSGEYLWCHFAAKWFVDKLDAK